MTNNFRLCCHGLQKTDLSTYYAEVDLEDLMGLPFLSTFRHETPNATITDLK